MGGRENNGLGVSWTTLELSESTLTSGRLQQQPMTRGMAQDGGRRAAGHFHVENYHCIESQWTTAVKKKGSVAFSLSTLRNMMCCVRFQGT